MVSDVRNFIGSTSQPEDQGTAHGPSKGREHQKQLDEEQSVPLIKRPQVNPDRRSPVGLQPGEKSVAAEPPVSLRHQLCKRSAWDCIFQIYFTKQQ